MKYQIKRLRFDYGRGPLRWCICGPHTIYSDVPLFGALRHPILAWNYLQGRPVHTENYGKKAVGYEQMPDGSFKVLYE